MDLYEAIEKRRTTRRFAAAPVEEEKLRRVLDAGLRAPANSHLRYWHFILVRSRDVRLRIVEAEGKKDQDAYDPEELRRRYADLPEVAREMLTSAVPLQKRMLLEAPELLVIVFRMPKPLAECERLYDLNPLASAWCSIENILLAMVAEGLYGVTYTPQQNAVLRQLLAIPDDYDIAALIPLGYPEPGAKQRPQVRPELGERVHADSFRGDTPFGGGHSLSQYPRSPAV